jgi:galactonate dehydratase
MSEHLISRMRTLRAEVGGGRTWVFVVVETTSGHVGVGEGSQSRLDEGVAAQVRALSSIYVGHDPREIVERRSTVLRRADAHRIFFAATSAIEHALLDLAGHIHGVPVYELLGGSARDEVPLYANLSLASGDGSPESYAIAARAAVRDGFNAVKIDAFDSLPDLSLDEGAENGSVDYELGVRRVSATRDAVGPLVLVLVDCASRLAAANAAEFAHRIAQFDPYWIEDAFHSPDLDVLSEFRAAVPMRVAGGEQLSGRDAFRRLLAARAVDVIMPDVKWIGGIREARLVAAMAESEGVEVAPHNMSGPVATAASVQVALTSPNCTMVEFCWGTPEWRNDLVGGTEVVTGGTIARTRRPGLGVALDVDSGYFHEI